MSVAIVIPAFCEENYIERTLASLETSAQKAPSRGKDCTVIVVVNNPIDASVDQIEENRRVLKTLKSKTYSFSLDVIDATFGLKNGVGQARKIGMDHATTFLSPVDLIVSLDADTEVNENYLPHLTSSNLRGAGFTLRFEHRGEENREAIQLYEKYLLYLRDQLQRIGSPFAFHTIGSAMGTNVRFYKLSGGMISKNATEDFHFLNKLRKYGAIEHWDHIVVYPSSRCSKRVFLGTGYFLSEYVSQPEEAVANLMFPAPEAFERLRIFLQVLPRFFEDPGAAVSSLQSDSVLFSFFEDQKLENRLKKLKENSASRSTFEARIPQIFDGVQTFRLLRKLML